jgi:hypothetical protein
MVLIFSTRVPRRYGPLSVHIYVHSYCTRALTAVLNLALVPVHLVGMFYSVCTAVPTAVAY